MSNVTIRDYIGKAKELTAEQEAAFLKANTESGNEIEIMAEVGGKTVGLAGISSLGNREKVRHRADFGISVDKEYWGLGIGRNHFSLKGQYHYYRWQNNL